VPDVGPQALLGGPDARQGRGRVAGQGGSQACAIVRRAPPARVPWNASAPIDR
jgi:hypothetical protein